MKHFQNFSCTVAVQHHVAAYAKSFLIFITSFYTSVDSHNGVESIQFEIQTRDLKEKKYFALKLMWL